ncbi:flagellar hook-associated protein FlgK [Clostridium sp. MSJ-8]|uniref:flagellar hook-associated protein FlgK n=1 Tax=Clostridium sp. MSJ-8 TaxID=2841510 RepID=UPI001C0EB9BD|nr:flagellar hook-associated protein FlgK [Clostridium sp. MSJ-8]MBU5488443.1 flagellar hook-associated protein FlgK [Clostridium sp. MSJ-8]
MSGLFGTLNIGRSGLNTSQTSVNVTSHNIANANTSGYSRQRAEIVTARPSSSYSYGQVGTGSQVEAIERIRDKFLDYQVRGENSTLGKAEIKDDILYQIETILNEPSDKGISTLIGKMFDAWQELSKQPSNSSMRTVVVQQTVALTDALNATYKKLEDLQQNAQLSLKTNAVDVNSILNQIDDLNFQIQGVGASGQNANDLMDKRDLLLDQLSKMFDIRVDSTKYDGINVSAVDNNGMVSSTFVSSDGTNIGARLSYISSIDADMNNPGVYTISYYKLGDSTSEGNKTTLKVSGLTEEEAQKLIQNRLIWANEAGYAIKADGTEIRNNGVVDVSELKVFNQSNGTIGGNVSVQDDIQNYMDDLDKLAQAIAYSINAIHSGKTDPLQDDMPFFVNADVAGYNSNNELMTKDVVLQAESKITAKNITINKELIDNVMKINTKELDTNGEGDGSRALSIAQLRDQLLSIQSIGNSVKSRSNLKFAANDVNGMQLERDSDGTTLDSYFQDIVDRLGVQAQEASRVVDNQNTMLTELENSRLSVSGVSLDEEMANLIQYQHAYSANAKIISTVDELLDVVVNGLKK